MALLIKPQPVPWTDASSSPTASQAFMEYAENLPIAELLTIDVGRLREGHAEEAAKVFKAATEAGAFYLDFSDPRCKMLEGVQDVFALSKELFQMSQEEKIKYDIDTLGRYKLNGYKPVGRNFGGINGKADGFESYTIPGKLHLLPSFDRPQLLSHSLAKFSSFCAETNDVMSLLLTSLSNSLNLPKDASLSALHRPDVASLDIVRLLHYLPQPATEKGDPQTPHTDLGSLTLLFTGAPGLQVLDPQSKKWVYVMPKPNCAVVNIGDGLSMLTGGLLHSCLHRVGPLPGQAMAERYSFAYLQRAEDDVKLAPLAGLNQDTTDTENVFTSREWLENKFGMLRAKTRKEGAEGRKILTGREGALP